MSTFIGVSKSVQADPYSFVLFFSFSFLAWPEDRRIARSSTSCSFLPS